MARRLKDEDDEALVSFMEEGEGRGRPATRICSAFVICAVAWGLFSLAMAAFPSYFAVYGNYCGPANGLNFQLEPISGLDTLCMMYDACVMAAIADKDDDGSVNVKANAGMRTFLDPRFGCDLKRCDELYINSMIGNEQMLCSRGGFLCRAYMWTSSAYRAQKLDWVNAAMRRRPYEWRKCNGTSTYAAAAAAATGAASQKLAENAYHYY